MAGQFNAASDRVSLAAAPDPGAGLTFAAWVRLDTDPGGFATILRLHASGGGSTTLTVAEVGTTPRVFSPSNTTGAVGESTTVGDWYYLAYSIDTDDAVTLYVAHQDDESFATYTATVPPGATPDGLTLAGRSAGDSDEPLPGTLAYVRLWSGVVLTESELLAERAAATAAATSGLWADWPLAEDLTDTSGNDRDLSAGTTAIDFVEGPTLPSAPARSGTVTLTASAAATLAGVKAGSGGVSLAAAAVPAVSGTRTSPGGVSLTAGAVLAASGARTAAGAVTLPAQAALAAAGVSARAGTVTLSATAALTARQAVDVGPAPASRTYTVPAESRVMIVPSEPRMVEA